MRRQKLNYFFISKRAATLVQVHRSNYPELEGCGPFWQVNFKI